MSQPLDVIFGDPEMVPSGLPDEGPREYAEALKRRIIRANAYVRRNMEQAVRRQRRQYHQDRKSFLPGAKVWLFTPQTATGEIRKLTKYWSGPWVVCAEPVNDVMVRIIPHPSWKKGDSKVVSIDRLKLYVVRKRAFPLEDDSDVEMAGDEFAEHIGGKRRRRDDDSDDDDDRWGGGGGDDGGGGGGGPPAVLPARPGPGAAVAAPPPPPAPPPPAAAAHAPPAPPAAAPAPPAPPLSLIHI